MSERVPSAHNIGAVLIEKSELASTNTFAKQLIANSEPVHGTVIMADFQRAGRGQKNNTWFSSPGKNLLLSIILKSPIRMNQDIFRFNKTVSLCMVRWVAKISELEAKIKWPNDIMIGEQKLAGLLIENIIQSKESMYTVLGIGLNVNQLFFPEDLSHATSLQLQTGVTYDVKQIRHSLFSYLQQYYEYALDESKKNRIDVAYQQALFGFGQSRNFIVNGEKKSGIVEQVDALGRLYIRFSDTVGVYQHGEIEFVLG